MNYTAQELFHVATDPKRWFVKAQALPIYFLLAESC